MRQSGSSDSAGRNIIKSYRNNDNGYDVNVYYLYRYINIYLNNYFIDDIAIHFQ